MKLIKPNVEYIPQVEGIEGIYKIIEIAGRTCYASEPKIQKKLIMGECELNTLLSGKDLSGTPNKECEIFAEEFKQGLWEKTKSGKRLFDPREHMEFIRKYDSKDFVNKLIKLQHLSVLEHGTVYLAMPYFCDTDSFFKYKTNPYSKANIVDFSYSGEDGIYVTTNMRVLQENNWLDDLQHICEPTEHHEKRITFNFKAISIGTSREFLRHRVFSFAQQSTRYCNYSKSDKFGEHLQFIKPYWINIPLGEYMENEELHIICPDCIDYNSLSCKERCFISGLMDAESDYLLMIHQGCKAQEAREVLPLALNAPLIMTGFVSDWKHFLSLRTHKSAHPDAVILAKQVENKLKELELL